VVIASGLLALSCLMGELACAHMPNRASLRSCRGEVRNLQELWLAWHCKAALITSVKPACLHASKGFMQKQFH